MTNDSFLDEIEAALNRANFVAQQDDKDPDAYLDRVANEMEKLGYLSPDDDAWARRFLSFHALVGFGHFGPDDTVNPKYRVHSSKEEWKEFLAQRKRQAEEERRYIGDLSLTGKLTDPISAEDEPIF